MLNAAELKALDYLVAFWNTLVRDVVGHSRTRHPDLAELGGLVHQLQNAVMAQSAARQHPGKFRLLGGLVDDCKPDQIEVEIHADATKAVAAFKSAAEQVTASTVKCGSVTIGFDRTPPPAAVPPCTCTETEGVSCPTHYAPVPRDQRPPVFSTTPAPALVLTDDFTDRLIAAVTGPLEDMEATLAGEAPIPPSPPVPMFSALTEAEQLRMFVRVWNTTAGIQRTRLAHVIDEFGIGQVKAYELKKRARQEGLI